MPGVRQTASGVVQTASGVSQTVLSDATIIDSFEDQDVSEYSGDTADVSFATTPGPVDGSYVLEFASNGTSEIQSTSGLPNYFATGEQCKVYFHSTDDANATIRFHYGAASTSSHYQLQWDLPADQIQVQKNDGGSFTNLASTSGAPITANQWYELDIKWDDGATFGGANGDQDVIIREYDPGTDSYGATIWDVNVSDSTAALLDNDGIGFEVRDNTSWTVVYDYVHKPGAGGGGTTITTIDSFEDQDLTEYTNVDGTDWSFVTSPVQEGTYAVQNDAFEQIYSVPGDGLPAYYAKGDGTLRWYVRTDGNATPTGVPWFRYGASDNDNSYYVRLDFSNGDFGINKEVAGSTSVIANSSTTVSDGEWYEFELVWDDGTLGGSNGDHTLTLTRVSDSTELATISGNDTDAALQSNEGIGIVGQGHASGETLTWDYIHKEV